VTAAGDWDEDWEEDQEPEPDDDWYDDDDLTGPERDPEDYEISREYEEYAEHCDTVHNGGECDCRPSLAERLARRAQDAARWLRGIGYRLTAATWEPRTLRIGPAEITVRLRADRGCGACQGRGWFYTLSSAERNPIPPGYNGAALCGCGSAIGKLAETRRYLRCVRDEPPF
jgi:hypothetical protein